MDSIYKPLFTTILIFMLGLNSCNDERIELPELTTAPITLIGITSAKTGGSIISLGNTSIEEKGVCWSTIPSPTVNDNTEVSPSESDPFVVTISGLKANTEYFVRSYAITAGGTTYGQEENFRTSTCGEIGDIGNTELECEQFIQESTGSDTRCCLSGPVQVTPGSMATYKIFTNIPEPEIIWTLASDSLKIVSGQGTSTIIIDIEQAFTVGCLSVTVDGKNGQACGLIYSMVSE